MRVEIERETPLRFGDGSPVRSASAIAAFGDGWLVVQDDATHAAWCRPGGIEAVRVLPAVGGHETFSAAESTKHLKPDFEAACPVRLPGGAGVLLLGSGSLPARMRTSLVTLTPTGTAFVVAELSTLYGRIAAALGLRVDQLNLEGACHVGRDLRWFQRGNVAAGVASASIDVDLPTLLAAAGGDPAARDALTARDARTYDLGGVDGVALAVTDAVALPDGRILASAAAEDTPNAVDDGPVLGAALAVLDGAGTVAVAPLPAPYKVEGLALRGVDPTGAVVLAVVDADDPTTPSTELVLRVYW